MLDMVSSKNIILIPYLFTYLSSVMADDEAIVECLNKLYLDFGYKNGQKRPNSPREILPIKAFLKMVENDNHSDEGKGYYKHIHDVMIPIEDMLLPIEFCNSQAEGETEKSKCIAQLDLTFLNIEDKTEVLRHAFWTYKETNFSQSNANGTINDYYLIKIGHNGRTYLSSFTFINSNGTFNYKFMYFYYLSQNFKFRQAERDFPFTPREFCKIKRRIDDVRSGGNSENEVLHEIGEGSNSPQPETPLYRTLDLF